MVIQQCGGECDGGHHLVHVQLRWDHSFISEPWCSAQMKASSSWKKPLSSGHKHFIIGYKHSYKSTFYWFIVMLSSKRTKGPKPKRSLRGHRLEFFLATRYSPYSNTDSKSCIFKINEVNTIYSDLVKKVKPCRQLKNSIHKPLKHPSGCQLYAHDVFTWHAISCIDED